MIWWGLGWRTWARDVQRVRQGAGWLLGRGPCRRVGRGARRVVAMALGVVVLTFWGSAAFATRTGDGEVRELGILGALTSAHDGHAIYLHYFTLFINRGNPVNDAWNMMFAPLLTLGWDLYRVGIGMGLWMLDVVTGFSWLEMLRVPAGAVAGVLNQVINEVGLVPALATLSVLISGFWLLRGRSGAGMGEIVVTLVVVSVMGTALANPVEKIAGPEGAISTAKDLGVGLTERVLDNGDGEPIEPDQRIMSALVRTPHQYINFGASLDRRGQDCAEAYDEFMTSFEEVPVEDLEGPCGSDVVHAAKNPSEAIIPMMVVMPAASGFALFVTLLLVALFLITLGVVWQAVKLVWEMLKAILPGSRQGLLESVCAVAVGLALMVAGLVAVAGFVLVVEAVFDQTADWDPVHVFVFVDLMMAAAVIGTMIMLFKGHKQGKKLGAKAAAAVAPKATSMSPAGSRGMSAVTAGLAAAGGHTLSRAGKATASGTWQASKVAGRATASGTWQASKFAGTATAKTAKFATLATVGAPVAAPAAAAAAKTALTARRAALQIKFAAAKAKASKVREDVTNYGKEYAHNVGVAGTFVGKVTGANAAARGAGHAGQAAGHWASSKAAVPVAAGAMAVSGAPAAAQPPDYSTHGSHDAPREQPVPPPSSPGPARTRGGRGHPDTTLDSSRVPNPNPTAPGTPPPGGARRASAENPARQRPAPRAQQGSSASSDPAAIPQVVVPTLTNRQRLEAKIAEQRRRGLLKARPGATGGSVLGPPVQRRR